jgi:hypothetical protein
MNGENDRRYSGRPGHVESWFIRANDPAAPRALWLKMTILAPLHGPAVAETWFIWFDGVTGAVVAHKDTVPITEASFEQGSVRVARCRFELSQHGALEGELATKHGPVSYALRLDGAAPPLSLFPFDVLLKTPFPRSKTLTPRPVLTLAGELRLPNETVKLDGWRGSQGHNWGREHTFEYAWGQCVFPASADGPETMLEGYSARIKLAGRTSPRMSALVVRRGGEELRFDRTFDFFRQEATLAPRRWTVRLKGPGGEARLRIDATDKPMVCLGYKNPDDVMSYCFNSKLADVLLEVRPKHGPEFRCMSPHGGALELLKREPEPGMEVV